MIRLCFDHESQCVLHFVIIMIIIFGLNEVRNKQIFESLFLKCAYTKPYHLTSFEDFKKF